MFEVNSADMASVPAVLAAEGFALCRDTGAGSERDLLEIARSIGSLDLEIDEELAGPPVMSIRFDPAKAAGVGMPAYFTSGVFPPHTDISYVENPPRYLLMLCLVADARGGGHSVVGDLAKAWDCLGAADRTELELAQFGFRCPPNTGSDGPGLLPVATVEPSWTMWRFRPDTMTVPARAAAAVEGLRRELDRGSVTLVLAPGDLLVVDNHRMVHGRSAFEPAPGAPSRHLLRAYAQDAARSAILLGRGRR